jgi:hypothetical protein
MARFNFRIGTKLGITASVSILLVGGMLTNQLIGNAAVTHSSQLVVVNGANRANAQAAESAMLRGQLALRDIGQALSADTVDASIQAFLDSTTKARTQADAASQRATRAVMQEFYRDISILIASYAAAGPELATAQKSAIASAISGREASDAWMRAFEAQLKSLEADDTVSMIDHPLRRATDVRWQALKVDKSMRAGLKQQRPSG